MLNFDETPCCSTFVPQTSENQCPHQTVSSVSAVFSYAIGPLASAQLRSLPVSLSEEDGQYSLLVPLHLPPELLTDPDFLDAAEYGYLEGNPQEEVWSVPKLVNELYGNLNELRERPEADIYPWTPGFLLGMLASIAEQDRTLGLTGLAHFAFLLPFFTRPRPSDWPRYEPYHPFFAHTRAIKAYRKRVRSYSEQGKSFALAQRLALAKREEGAGASESNCVSPLLVGTIEQG